MMSKSIIQKYLDFCNTRHEYHARKSSQLENVKPRVASFHRQTSDTHKEMCDWFIEYLENPPLIRQSIDDLFSINPLELDELDEDIRDELSISTSDINDAQILELLEIAHRSLDLNEIILGCFRKFSVKHKRIQLTARIHRMVNKNEVKVVGKGRYALPSMEDEEYSIDEILDDI